jgi:hypothetical protein
VEIDKSVFKVSQPLALHYTKNFKYDTVRWRSIVEMKDGNNKGLSTHILNRIEKLRKSFIENYFLKKDNKLKMHFQAI